MLLPPLCQQPSNDWRKSTYGQIFPILALGYRLFVQEPDARMSNMPFAALPAAQRLAAQSAITAVLGAATVAKVQPIIGYLDADERAVMMDFIQTYPGSG